jgi:hypothetical protein
MENNQGKRKDQIDFSDKIVMYCILGMGLLIVGLSIYNFFKRIN